MHMKYKIELHDFMTSEIYVSYNGKKKRFHDRFSGFNLILSVRLCLASPKYIYIYVCTSCNVNSFSARLNYIVVGIL